MCLGSQTPERSVKRKFFQLFFKQGSVLCFAFPAFLEKEVIITPLSNIQGMESTFLSLKLMFCLSVTSLSWDLGNQPAEHFYMPFVKTVPWQNLRLFLTSDVEWQASGRRGRVRLSDPLLAFLENPCDSLSSAVKPGEPESHVLE